jgi:hypothetical protein
MFFTIQNKKFLSTDQLRADTLLNAYFIIQKYPLKASELALNQYLQQQYKKSLKNICIQLLLNFTFYSDDAGNLVLMFKDPKYDKLARLITYGNGVSVQGSKILQNAFER